MVAIKRRALKIRAEVLVRAVVRRQEAARRIEEARLRGLGVEVARLHARAQHGAVADVADDLLQLRRVNRELAFIGLVREGRAVRVHNFAARILREKRQPEIV